MPQSVVDLVLTDLKRDYRTIANFRQENWSAQKAVNRSFVLPERTLGLVGGSVVAIDGFSFHGDASKASILTRKRLAERTASWTRRSSWETATEHYRCSPQFSITISR